MPSVIDCPSCTRKLRVPEELVGQEVKCPTCGTTFTAQESGPEPAPRSAPPPPPREELEPPRSSRRSSRPRYDDEDDDYENRRRPRRRHLEPHRGSTIQMLGILSFFIAGFILGPMAWIMGSSDLKAMREGRMDPSGESETNTGRICGMISTLLHVGGVVVCCGGWLLMMLIGAAASSTAPPAPRSQPPLRKFFHDSPLRLRSYLPGASVERRPVEATADQALRT